MTRQAPSLLISLAQVGISSALRMPLALGFVVLSTFCSYFLALGLRFDFDTQEMPDVYSMIVAFAILLVCRIGASWYFDLHKMGWRHTSTMDLSAIIKAHGFSSILLACGVLLVRVPAFARSLIFIELVLSLLLAGGVRIVYRLLIEHLKDLLRADNGRAETDVIVLGGGDSGHFLIKHLLANKSLGYKPVAVLDDSEKTVGLLIYGVAVSGRLADLDKILSVNTHVGAVILAIPSLAPSRFDEIKRVCSKYDVLIKRLQSFDDIAVQDAARREPSVSVESVLKKAVEPEFRPEVVNAVCGKVVLVTGAGGSIGSELVRQISQMSPSNLVLLDSCEYNLFKIDLELTRNFPNLHKQSFIADIRDTQRLNSIFEQTNPHLVYHAAAYKHVPMMQSNAYEAFRTNVVGTLNVLDACRHYGAGRFILISTDKAVQPQNIMGRSKRLAEMLVMSVAANAKNTNNKLQAVIVRFGNVINSSGSVIPLFKEQILSGGPITVTHPDVERFFMSIQEAVKLVLTASVAGNSGQIYVLNMGDKIKIADLAKKMLALYGRRDIPIVFTGLRPGEALTEELHSPDETLIPSPIDGVKQIKNSIIEVNDIISLIREGDLRVASMSNENIERYMMEILVA